MERFDIRSLNPPQQEAVRHRSGPLLILAGAGTGKTRVITCRIAHLIGHDIAPANILAVTFTNKAAREMQERVAGMLGAATAKQLTIGTFHGFCVRLLRTCIDKLGYNRGFGIAPQNYQAGLMKSVMSERGFTGEGYDPDRFLSRISRAKNAMQSPDDLQAEAVLPLDHAIADVYALYQSRLKLMDMVDFDDILGLVLQLWDRFPDLLTAHRQVYRYLLVDEYQDTNQVQFQLVSRLAGTDANLCVVGDDDQSIYGWRGATIENILSFEQHFPGAKVIRLEQNYRSTDAILAAANHVIAGNPRRHQKKLWSRLGAGDRPITVSVPDEEQEARTAVDIVQDGRGTRKRAFDDFAVLYRSNHQSRGFEQAFRLAQIPYTLVGSHGFYERKEILDAITLLQAVLNPRDDLALLRVINVPPRGLGDKSIERLKELRRVTGLPLQQLLVEPDFLLGLGDAATSGARGFVACLEKYRDPCRQPGDLARKLEGVLTDSGYLEGFGRMYKPKEDALNRRENVMEFITAAAEFEQRHAAKVTLADFLERIALLDDHDRTEGTKERGVTLMTVHAAKGLEFPVVMLAGLEQGLFPHQNSMDEGGVEEERRLFYVALTRAREQLFLLHCEHRKVRGTPSNRRPSQFLEDLPEELVDIRSLDNLFAAATQEQVAEFFARMKERFSAD